MVNGRTVPNHLPFTIYHLPILYPKQVDALRQLPKIDDLANSPELAGYAPKLRVQAARAAVEFLRTEIKSGNGKAIIQPAQLAAQLAESMTEPSIKPVINLSGVILHTGLGRARLAPSVANQVAAVAANHSAVELDLEEGRRGDRQEHVRDLFTRLTGAEDAFVVNNAAAGVLLTLTALCFGSEVILSRGQMVEIGGSFRMPDIVRQSGCTLVEVGCTNKTRLSDYQRAFSEETSAILRCHPSNFKIVGFTEEPSIQELATICKDEGIILIDDQGSGCLIDLAKYGLPEQPTLPGSIAGGADVAIASGDKLLGGPQAGIIVGRKDLIAEIKQHPLARCVRIDKLTLAALEGTLRLYTEGREEEIPTIRSIGKPLEDISKMARSLAKAFKGTSEIALGETEVGGGSAPGMGLPTWRVGLATEDPDQLAKTLRSSNPPIVGRIEDNQVWLDPRTLEPEELKLVVKVLSSL